MTIKTSAFTLLFSDRSLEGAVEAVARAGYQAVEIMGREPHLSPTASPQRVREIAAYVKSAGLKVSCLATYTGNYSQASMDECGVQLRMLQNFVEFAGILECDLVRHSPGGPSDYQATPAHWQRAAEWMAKACDLAEAAGVRLAMEIHAGSLVETADSSRRLLEMIGRCNLGVILDPGNMFIAGADYGEEAVRKLWPSVFHVHVKDEQQVEPATPGAFASGGRYFLHRLLGEGEVDHLPAFRALARLGYQGYVSAEYHGPGNREACAAHELQVMRRLIEKAEAQP